MSASFAISLNTDTQPLNDNNSVLPEALNMSIMQTQCKLLRR
jgi:hypothetical protein